MSNLKGSGWLTCRDFFLQKLGQANYDKVIASLSPDDQSIFTKTILPISWIDYGAYIRFNLAADKMFGKGDFGLIHEANRYGAQKDVNGLYRILFRILSPEFVLSNLASIWRQYYDKGEVKVVKAQRGHAIIELSDMRDVPLHHDQENCSYFEEVLRMCKCKNIRSNHPKCMARGDDVCRSEFFWE